MSRIGKQIIKVPEKTTCEIKEGLITVTGPLGTLTRSLPARLTFNFQDGIITIVPKGTAPADRSLWGTYGAHLKNMVAGVNVGFKKVLLIEGVGYRVAIGGTTLTLNLGFSHPVELPIPAGLKIAVDKGQITIEGIDRELVGQFSAVVRGKKRVEPYKGKGIRYHDEIIRRKAGKKVIA